MPDSKHSSVILDIRPGESIRVSDLVVVQLLHKSGHLSRLRITAPREMPIKMQSGPPCVVPSMTTLEPS
ncbi:MAG: Global regulator protein family [Pseudomonadota bacterium]|jgi:hypothetical protein